MQASGHPNDPKAGPQTQGEGGNNTDSSLTDSLLAQVHTMLGGMAGRSAQHRDMLCRMAALSLAALATGSLQSDANLQVAARCASEGSLAVRIDYCKLVEKWKHEVKMWQSQ